MRRGCRGGGDRARPRRGGGSTGPSGCSSPRPPSAARADGRGAGRLRRGGLRAGGRRPSVLLDGNARARGAAAKERAEAELEGLELTAREAEQRVRRASGAPSGRSCSRRSRSSRRGIATSSSSPPAPRRRSSTPTGWSSCARTRRTSGRSARSARCEDRAGDVARARGVQPRPAARARGALRPAAPRVRSRSGRMTPLELVETEAQAARGAHAGLTDDACGRRARAGPFCCSPSGVRRCCGRTRPTSRPRRGGSTRARSTGSGSTTRASEAHRGSVAATAALPPIEREVESWRFPNGTRVSERRIPIGTVGANFEARPNVAARRRRRRC